MEEKKLSEKESLDLIAQMINKAKASYHDTGVGAMMWGIVIAVCALVKFTEIHFDYRLPFDIYLLTAAAIIPQIFLTIKSKRARTVKSYDEAFMDYLWLAFGICIFLLIFIDNHVFKNLNLMVADYRATKRVDWVDFRFSEYVSSLFLMLYGLPTFVTGAACKIRPMLFGGLFCWVCCVITVYTDIKIDLLLTAASAILAWFIPGVYMARGYKKAKKELKEHNV